MGAACVTSLYTADGFYSDTTGWQRELCPCFSRNLVPGFLLPLNVVKGEEKSRPDRRSPPPSSPTHEENTHGHTNPQYDPYTRSMSSS